MRAIPTGSECSSRPRIGQPDRDAGEREDAPPLVGDRVDLPASQPHADEQDEVGDDRRDRGAHHPVGRDEREVEGDVDGGRGPAHDPVELGLPHPADPDREHRVARSRRRSRSRGSAPPRPSGRSGAWERRACDDPRREHAEGQRHPAGQEEQVGEHVGVGALGGVVVADRVGERRPGELERGHQEDDHRRDLHGERVDADLALPPVGVDEEPVDQVDRPEREGRGHERQPEPVHRSEQPAVELQPELLAAEGEQHDVDGERAEEVPDHGSDRALVERRSTSAIVAPIVISTLATLAIANCTGRSSTRKSEVICA